MQKKCSCTIIEGKVRTFLGRQDDLFLSVGVLELRRVELLNAVDELVVVFFLRNVLKTHIQSNVLRQKSHRNRS